MGTYFIDGEYENVNFLGYTVTMPNAERIQYYRDKMNAIIKEYNFLENCIQGQADKVKAEGSGAWATIQSEFWLGFEDDLNGCIVAVLSDNIAMDAVDIAPDISLADEFGKNTKAYKELINLRRNLVREARNIQDTYENNYQRGQNVAFSRAASNIKGMGFGIITNSAVDLLAYNAISNATLKSQARKADRQYENDLKQLHKSTFGSYKNQLLSLMFEQYIPAARRCIAMWANEVTEKLIAYEVGYNDNAVFAEISKFSPEQSQVIVDKIDLKSSYDNIRKELLEAFKKCPYNESIYLKAAQVGLLDRDTFEYGAGNYRFEKSIKDATKKYCSENLDDIDLVKKQISFMVVKYVNTEQEILEEIYTPFVSSLIQKYNVLKSWTDRGRSIKPFIVNELKIQDIATFVEIGDASLQDLLESYISKLVSKKRWNILVDNNLIDWKKISLNDTCEYDSMNAYYIDMLLPKILEYRAIMSTANINYIKTDNEYKNKCNELQLSIEELEKEISQLGVFSFKKKKVLREELEKQKLNYYEYTKNNKPVLNWT